MARHLRSIVGLSAAGAALWLAFSGVDVGSITSAVRSANVLWLAVASLSVFLTVACVALRFRLLAVAWCEAPPFRLLWHVTIVGQVANLIVPFRIGDGVKVVSGSRGLGVRPAVLAAMVAVERLLDAMVLVLASLLLLVSGYALAWTRNVLAGAALAGVLVVAVGLIVTRLIAHGRVVPQRRSRFGAILGFVARQIDLMRSGMAAVSTRRVGTRLLLGTLGIAAASALTNLLTLWAFGLDVPPPVALLLLVLVQSGNAVTGAPGGLGVAQFIAVETLGLWGVAPATALACSLTLFVIVRLPKIVMLPMALSALSLTRHEPKLQV